jgi:hypothetical protein
LMGPESRLQLRRWFLKLRGGPGHRRCFCSHSKWFNSFIIRRLSVNCQVFERSGKYHGL